MIKTLPILEGLVTTTNPDGSMHCAPMGPHVDSHWRYLLLRPFPTSHTFHNLKARGEGVLHVTDNVLLMAKAAVGELETPEFRLAERIEGYILLDACRFYEFQVIDIDDSGERIEMNCEVVHTGSTRDFWGFNRAKHAVLEAAILATRLHILPIEDVRIEYRKLGIIVEKTGGEREIQAFEFLLAYLDRIRKMKEQR